jgi:hypothetical protein
MLELTGWKTGCVAVATCLALAGITHAATVKETVVYAFQEFGPGGSFPAGGVIADKAGNLYGTTNNGGTGSCALGCGTVFELTPPAVPGGTWTELLLYSFQGGNDGGQALCTLVMDKAGNLYGTATEGGSFGYGVVFELSPPPQPGDVWTETVLYSFQEESFCCEDHPEGTLLRDGFGNLYGTTYLGGDRTKCGGLGCGTVFEVSPPSPDGGNWTEAALYSFQGGTDGEAPLAPLISDGKTLYGTTLSTVFQLLPPSQRGGYWTENVLLVFNGANGSYAAGGLNFDKAGNLYGTTQFGGPLSCDEGRDGCGSVYELSPPLQPDGAWTETVLYDFRGPGSGDGRYPSSGLIFDQLGDLYGTTSEGGQSDAGTVFQLVPPSSQGGAWTEKHFSLCCSAGENVYYPYAGLIFGPGVAVTGTGTGSFGGGGVFSIGR